MTFDGFDATDSVFQAFVWGISGDSWARIRYSVPIASFQSNLSVPVLGRGSIDFVLVFLSDFFISEYWFYVGYSID